jgi:fibronectin-binding autotransporter adhesin
MISFYRYALVWCVAILALGLFAPRANAQYATEIAITGVQIPGASGNAFSAFDQPIINNVGQVAFLGFFPGGQGIFSVNGHPVNTLPGPTDNALDPALRSPGATFPNAPLLNSIQLTSNQAGGNAGGTISAFTVNPPQNPGGVTLNNVPSGSANTVYGSMAILTQLNGNSLQGVFTTTSPSIITPGAIALTNAPAPNTTSTYASLANSPAINDNNNIAFVGNLANGNEALFFGPISGAQTAIAQTGSAAPGPNNLFFSFTGAVSLVSVANSGSGVDYLAFQAGIINSVTGISSSAIIVGSSTTASIVAQTGTNVQAAGVLTGYVYQNFVDPVSLGPAHNGQVAFRANLFDAAATPTTAAALFVASNGASPVVIGATNNLVGTPLPSGYSTTFPFGATYNGFGGVTQNTIDGQVAFVATLAPLGSVSGGGGGGGIFLSKNQSSTVSHIAVSGDIAAGTNGATYSSFFNDVTSTFSPIFNDTSVALNNHAGTNGAHEVAFQAFLAGSGVNGGNNQALFVANDQLLPGSTNQTETAILARSGELLTTNPGVQKIVQDFMGFYTGLGNGANSFNDFGQLASEVDFTDGTHGIYVFTPDLHLSPFTVTTPTTVVSWGTASPAGGPPTPNTFWTLAYNPADQLYRVIIDPADVGLPTITVKGPTASQSIPGLQVSSNTGIAHFVLTGGTTLTLGGGAITSGINVLTIQGPSDITVTGGATATLKLLGDVTSLAASGTVSNAGNFTANITPNIDLGNVPYSPVLPNFTLPPPSVLDIDRFRSFNVARGNFVGTYPVDLLLSGIISSPSETISVNGTTATNDVHRGILKTGNGVLRLTGANTFGPDTSITDDPYTVNPPSTVSYVQSIEVTGGLLSFASDSNLGAAPSTTANTNVAFVRWITLDGGGIGLETTATSTLANPTVINATRGIAVGPVTGQGGGTIDVFGTNVLDYEGVISDNSNGITMGIGSLIKTGLGTLILSGPNTYSGGTFVNQGTLMVTTDAGLGAPGTPVTVNTGATLNYSGSATTTRSFTLNSGNLSVAAGKTVTFNNTMVLGGFLGGPGAFATSVGGSTSFVGTATQPSASLTLNGADTLINFSNGGLLTVGPGAGPVTFSQVTNQGSGTITLSAGSAVNVVDFQSYGVLNINNATTMGAVTILTNVGGTPIYFNGGSRTFIGTVGGNGQSQLELNGQNAIVTSGLLVNNGKVTDSSAAGISTIIADYGALVKGAGIYDNSVKTQNGGKFQVGNSPGVATFGSFVFGPGGVSNYIFAIDNATGQAGPTPDAAGYVNGWGLIKTGQWQRAAGMTSGEFDWTADPSNKLTFAIDTLINPTMAGTDVSGLMANFDPSKSYSWPAVQWVGAYSGPNDVAALDAATTFDTSGFVNPIAGTFGWSIDPTAHQLDLVYTPSAVPEPGTLALVGLAVAAGWRWRRGSRRI